MSFNRLQLQGRLEKHPEVKMMKDFKMATLFLQVRNNKDQIETFEITAWGKTAEWAEKNCEKGSIISMEGKVGISSWGEGENKKSKIRITADKLNFCRCHMDQAQEVAPAVAPKPVPQKAPDVTADFDELPF
jgi:single-strand DNA-binding protein